MEHFKKEDKLNILELGAGQGRDTLFFAKNSLQVYALDYSENAVEAINQKARRLGLSQHIAASRHDVRKPLPFNNESFGGCYSHMLYSMALTTGELEFLFQEVRRVLKPDGLNIYTVRHTGDAHYKKGSHRCEDIFEINGFAVHFFSREKVAHLSKGYDVISIDEFEEGKLPRKLFLVVLRKKG
jgi:SAM-dependent methyltransferase